MAAQDVLESVKKNKLEIGDFKFVDAPGLWHHFPVPAAKLAPDVLEDSIGFDGSSIRGFQSSMPGLDEALDALQKDHDFLLRGDGDVFTKDVIETWLEYQRKKEVDAIRLRPHPHECGLYFDI